MSRGFFKTSVIRFSKSVKDYPVTFVSSLLLFILLSIDSIISGSMRGYEVIGDYINSGIYALFVATIFSIVVTTFLRYRGENIEKEKKLTILATAGSFVVWFVLSIAVLLNGYSNYMSIAEIGISMIILCLGIMVIDEKKKDGNIYLYMLRAAFVAFFISSIILAGLEICYSAFDMLIYSIPSSCIYTMILFFAYELVFINIFVSYIPRKDQIIYTGRLFRGLIDKILLPLYLVLMAILYVYIAKIVFTGNIPSGQMNWFASLAMLGFVFFYMIVPDGSRVAKYYRKYSGLMMLPVLVTQLIFIYIRIDAYGFTTARILSILFIACGTMFLVNSFLKRDIKYVLIICSVIMFIGCISPVNAEMVAKHTQKSRMISILEKYDRYKDEKISKTGQKVSDEDQLKLSSCYTYLKETEGNGDKFIDNIKKYPFKDLFGIKYKSEESEASFMDETVIEYTNDVASSGIDIKKYSKLYVVDYENESGNPCVLKLKDRDDNTIEVDMTKFIGNIMSEHGITDTSNVELQYKVSKKIKLVLSDLYVTLDNSGKITKVYFIGYEFVK